MINQAWRATKAIGGGTGFYIQNLAVSAVTGLLLNWGYLIGRGLTKGVFPSGSLVWLQWVCFVMTLIGFPILFFLLGQKQGMQAAMRQVYRTYHPEIVGYVLQALLFLKEKTPEK